MTTESCMCGHMFYLSLLGAPGGIENGLGGEIKKGRKKRHKNLWTAKRRGRRNVFGEYIVQHNGQKEWP